MRGTVSVENFTHDEVGVLSVWIWVDGNRLEQAIGAAAFGLFGRTAVKRPHSDVFKSAGEVVFAHLRLAAQTLCGLKAVQPNVFQF